ncbi:MAG: septum formation initiator family protein [Clostridia bacterium]|nr:septum formation initiator family protein [Clostridia bacterium]
MEYEKQRIKEIDEVSEKVGTDEYTEKVAREKLGMIKSDEIVFVDISGQ